MEYCNDCNFYSTHSSTLFLDIHFLHSSSLSSFFFLFSLSYLTECNPTYCKNASGDIVPGFIVLMATSTMPRHLPYQTWKAALEYRNQQTICYRLEVKKEPLRNCHLPASSWVWAGFWESPSSVACCEKDPVGSELSGEPGKLIGSRGHPPLLRVLSFPIYHAISRPLYRN